MSTIKVNSIKNTSTDDGGIAIDNSGHVQIDGQQLPTAGPLSNRNLILNGACRVNQRQTTPSVSNNNVRGPVDHFETRTTCDQWQGQLSQETVSVNNEFTSCLRVKTTTAETTVDGTNQIIVETHVEGQDVQHLSHGTSDAKPLTLSFWVRSSQAGTYVVKIYRLDGANGRQLNKTYTINAADTWEYKTFTFVGDTSGGAIPDTASEGFRVGFQVAAGSGFTSGTQPTTWTAYTNPIWAAGHVTNSVMTTVNATWDVTGIQLEVGEKATPFEHRSFGDELAGCQRYYQTGKCWLIGFGSTNGFIGSSNNFNTSMRVDNPNVVLGSPTENVNFNTVYSPAVHKNGFRLYGKITTGTNINAYYTNTFTASAEL